jgi:hypothetical protein
VLGGGLGGGRLGGGGRPRGGLEGEVISEPPGLGGAGVLGRGAVRAVAVASDPAPPPPCLPPAHQQCRPQTARA